MYNALLAVQYIGIIAIFFESWLVFKSWKDQLSIAKDPDSVIKAVRGAILHGNTIDRNDRIYSPEANSSAWGQGSQQWSGEGDFRPYRREHPEV